MFQKIILPHRSKEIKKEKDSFMVSIEREIAIAFAKEFNETIFKALYDFYKEQADELIVINETDFKDFIIRFLPIYLRREEGIVMLSTTIKEKLEKNELLKNTIISLSKFIKDEGFILDHLLFSYLTPEEYELVKEVYDNDTK